MSSLRRRRPASVVTAIVLTMLLALLFGGVVAVFGFVGKNQDLAIGGLVILALLLLLAWRLGRGGRGARVVGIAVGAALVLAAFYQTQGVVALAIFVFLGLALIVSLTVPARSRAYFRTRRTAR